MGACVGSFPVPKFRRWSGNSSRRMQRKGEPENYALCGFIKKKLKHDA
jgi:hypothetical protein